MKGERNMAKRLNKKECTLRINKIILKDVDRKNF